MSYRAAERGQTGIDFAVGIALFLLAVAFVLAFVPSMFAPFYVTGSGDGIVADRSAAYLTDNALVEDPARPGSLNGTDTDNWFEECDDTSVGNELGIGTDTVNVTIDGSEDWSCGPTPDGPETASTRIVMVDGEQRTLRVVVW